MEAKNPGNKKKKITKKEALMRVKTIMSDICKSLG